jgi:hypothetical protein
MNSVIPGFKNLGPKTLNESISRSEAYGRHYRLLSVSVKISSFLHEPYNPYIPNFIKSHHTFNNNLNPVIQKPGLYLDKRGESPFDCERQSSLTVAAERP